MSNVISSIPTGLTDFAKVGWPKINGHGSKAEVISVLQKRDKIPEQLKL